MPRNSGTRRSHGGRIRPYERDTNDAVPIIGADIEVNEDHRESVRATLNNGRDKRTLQNNRNRIREICRFLQENYRSYCDAGGVRDLTQDERTNQDIFHHNNTVDLKYEGMNTRLIMAFLAAKKTKANGKTASHAHLRKYNDAILYGAEQIKENLPTEFYVEMNNFLNAFKKEFGKAREEGKVDEREADPISWALFRIILGWALTENNVFVWVFSLLQWSCMARSINIGVLSFHNFRLGEDNIVCRYDKHKSDQTGETAHDKHLFGNPFDGLVNLYLGLGVWFSVEAAQFANSEDLFKRGDTNAAAASHRYCAQLAELFTKYKGMLENYIRPGHASSHSTRKGSGTFAQSGTTCPAPISSTAGRGEWSLGPILDLYWLIAEAGDCYLGRILAGLDPNDASFGTLPPHFTMTDPMSNTYVREVMQLMYGPILRRWSGHEVDPSGLLLRCLASVVWHSDFLKWARKVPGHSFSTIPLLNNEPLLHKLKELVTTEPTESMKVPTGIPPHVNNAIVMKKVLDLCIDTLEEVKALTTRVQTAVSEAYEAKAMENGQITTEQMKAIFAEYETEIKSYVGNQIASLRQEMPMRLSHKPAAPAAEDNFNDFGVPFAEGELESQPHNASTTCFRNFAHGGRFWCVPETFQLPSRTKLENGWRIWIQGLPGFQIEDRDHIARAAPIRPFRKFANAMLPPEIKQRFCLYWSPIFRVMEETPGLEIPEDDPSSIDGDFLANSFSCATAYLREHRLQYVFLNTRAKPNDWEVATWSKHIRRSEIEKYGTDEDKANLPEASRFNGSRVQHSNRKRAPAVDDSQGRVKTRRRERRQQAKGSSAPDCDTSLICAAGHRCEMHGAPAPSTHRCPTCDRHIHAICGILMENAPNEFHNRMCFDCHV